MINSDRNIKVYGTLLNATVNSSIGDNDHNDAIVYAYLVYDDKFGQTPNINNFQDVINKRVTAISYNNGVTTINSDLNIAGNYNVGGSVHFDNIDVSGNVTSQNITQLTSDVAYLLQKFVELSVITIQEINELLS